MTAGERQLSIDDFFELGLGLSDAQEDPIDKNPGCAVNTSLDACLPVCIDAGLEFAAGEAGPEGPLLETDRPSALDQIGIVQLCGIGEKRVVKLPKLSLLAGAPRRLRGRFSMGVDFPHRRGRPARCRTARSTPGRAARCPARGPARSATHSHGSSPYSAMAAAPRCSFRRSNGHRLHKRSAPAAT